MLGVESGRFGADALVGASHDLAGGRDPAGEAVAEYFAQHTLVVYGGLVLASLGERTPMFAAGAWVGGGAVVECVVEVGHGVAGVEVMTHERPEVAQREHPEGGIEIPQSGKPGQAASVRSHRSMTFPREFLPICG
ncbi:hypothetical protein DWB68_13285 [Galactobacter valiniphilus]|uniref:Uncharacterized protein n=1 Tax=Galactobacter valiniphilus TaxID=2676122 RepID=A0A399J898_9MICC|nr:hypothetical protein DWB68_13285 [Galactobacter valiniphilus]